MSLSRESTLRGSIHCYALDALLLPVACCSLPLVPLSRIRRVGSDVAAVGVVVAAELAAAAALDAAREAATGRRRCLAARSSRWGFNRSMSTGLGPYTGRQRRFSSALRSLTTKVKVQTSDRAVSTLLHP